MKKLASALLTGIFLLSLVTIVHASPVLWDQDRPFYQIPSGSFTIPYSLNGAYFHYDSYHNYANTGMGDSSSVIGIPAFDSTPENFGGNPGDVEFVAESSGETRPDGLLNTGYAEIIATGLSSSNGIDGGHQKLVSSLYRNFVPSGPGMVEVTADISGLVTWPLNYNGNFDTEYGYALDYPYYAYTLKGVAEIWTFSVSAGSQIASIDPIELDQNTLSGSIQFIADADPDIYYVLFSSLVVETYAANADWMGISQGLFPDGIKIGENDDPLAMTTSVTQSPVPIPGSLILLVSGLAGLAIRRKTSNSGDHSLL